MKIKITEISELKDFVNDTSNSLSLVKKVTEKSIRVFLDPSKKYSRKDLLRIIDDMIKFPMRERPLFEFDLLQPVNHDTNRREEI